MEKSKLGISLNLFAAMLYFLGAAEHVFVVLIAAGFVLLVEEDKKLKRTAIKALIIAIALIISTSLISYLLYLLSYLADIFRMFNIIDNNQFVYSNLSTYINVSINQILYICRTLILVVLGFRAYKHIDVKIKWIDKILDKHF